MELLVWLAFWGAVLALWLAAVVGCIRRAHRPGDKLLWLILILFIPMLGPLAYLLLGRKDVPRPVAEDEVSLLLDRDSKKD